MPFTSADLAAIGLTLRLALTTMVLLLVLCTQLAWWLARTRSRWRGPVSAVVALPLVLPPTVIGFYLLVSLGPNGPLGQLTLAMGLGTLPSQSSAIRMAKTGLIYRNEVVVLAGTLESANVQVR